MNIGNIKYLTPAENGGNGAVVCSLDKGDRISPFYAGMLKHNTIDGIIDYSVQNNDDSEALVYDTQGYVPLSRMMSEPVSRSTFFALTDKIAQIIEGAEGYMMEESRFLLSSDYVMVDMATLDVKLIILPVCDIEPYSFRSFVRLWVIKGRFDLTEDGKYPDIVARYMNKIPQNIGIKKMRADLADIRDGAKEFDVEDAGGSSLASRVLSGISFAAAPKKAAPAPTPDATAEAAPTDAAPTNAGASGGRLGAAVFRLGLGGRPGIGGARPGIGGARQGAKIQAEPKKPDVAAKLTADNGSEHPINTCEFRIGSGVGVGLTVNDPKVSRNHAVIEFENGEYYIRDLYSANGTFVNEKRLAANTRTKLADGDTIALADKTYKFCIGK